MAGRTKQSQSEIDGVKYRRAKTWQIILVACNAFTGMSVYTLIGMASYSASVGYGITTAVVGIILTCTRILDGVTDPLVAFLYDKVDTKFGKLRKLPVSGFVVEAAALQNDPRRQLYSFPYLFRYSLGEVPVSFLKQA